LDTNFFGTIRNLVGPKMGGVFIVLVIFISFNSLGHGIVKNYWACAGLFPPPFERGRRLANGTANSPPVKRPIDWVVPDYCERHASHMCDDLPRGTYLLPLSSLGRAASRF
jgi:hypothetical protein